MSSPFTRQERASSLQSGQLDLTSRVFLGSLGPATTVRVGATGTLCRRRWIPATSQPPCHQQRRQHLCLRTYRSPAACFLQSRAPVQALSEAPPSLPAPHCIQGYNYGCSKWLQCACSQPRFSPDAGGPDAAGSWKGNSETTASLSLRLADVARFDRRRQVLNRGTCTTRRFCSSVDVGPHCKYVWLERVARVWQEHSWKNASSDRYGAKPSPRAGCSQGPEWTR